MRSDCSRTARHDYLLSERHWKVTVVLLIATSALLAACGPDSGNLVDSDNDRFRLVSVVPSVGVNDVPVTGLVAATFSDDLDPKSLTDSSFVLTSIPGNTALSGTISYFGRTATFRPFSNLKYGTDYFVLISSEIKSLSGRPLVDTSWSFRTEGDSLLPDPPPPPEN